MSSRCSAPSLPRRIGPSHRSPDFSTGTFTSRPRGHHMNVRPADPRSHADSEFHFSEQPQPVRGTADAARAGPPLRREGSRAAWRAMGARRQDPARDLPPHGRARFPRHAPRGRIWRHRYGPAGVDGVGGGTRALDLRRLHLVGAGSYRHVGGPHHAARHAGAEAEISARDHPRRDDLLDRGDRARCRLRRRRVEDAGPPRRRLLGDQRLENVHHQCGLWRHPDRRRAHRSRTPRAAAAFRCSSSSARRRASP